MTSIELFNGLNGKTVSRNYLEEILQQAKAENQTAIVYRLSKVLNDNPKYKRFEMTIQSYPHAKGLAGIQHTGDYREALDDCGRLRKGWKFVKGSVVRVEKKEKKEKNFSFEFGKPIAEKTIHQYYYSYDDFSNLSDSNLAKAYAYTMLAIYLARNQKIYFDYFKKNATYILFEVAKPEREKALVEELKKRNIIVKIDIDFSEIKQTIKTEKEYKITNEIRLQYPKSYTDDDIIASMKKMDKFRKNSKEIQKKKQRKKGRIRKRTILVVENQQKRQGRN